MYTILDTDGFICCDYGYVILQSKLAGCSSYSLDQDFSENIRPVLRTESNHDQCIGQADATVHASCCHAPSLECKVQEYSPVDFTTKVRGDQSFRLKIPIQLRKLGTWWGGRTLNCMSFSNFAQTFNHFWP